MRVAIIKMSTDNGFGSKVAREIEQLLDLECQSIHVDDVVRAGRGLLEDFDSFIFVMPEFNGSMPGRFKQMIDDSGWPSTFKGKNVATIGYSGGLNGNLMGVNHMRYVLEYIEARVVPGYFTIGKSSDINDDYLKSHIEKYVNQIKQWITK